MYALIEKLCQLFAQPFFFLGMILHFHSVQLAPNDIINWSGHHAAVQGEIIEVPEFVDLGEGKNRVRYIVAAKKVIEDQQVFTASGCLMIDSKQNAGLPAAAVNDQLTASGEIVLPHGYQNPGLIDTAAGLKRKGITARMSAAGNMIAFQSCGGDGGWKTLLASWRQTMTANMQKVMPDTDAAILTGMLFGGYAGIKPEVIKDFAATGIVHILSVSGTHIALVAGVILWIGRRFHFPYLLLAVLSGGSILFYGFLSGFTPPVVRSVIMGIIALAAVGFEREKDGPGALALAILGMLIYQPDLIYDISFQLSAGATAGILFFYSRTVSLLSFLPEWLRCGLAVTWSAQVGVLPFLAWYFNNLSLSAFPANMIVVPIIELLVVLGLAGTILNLLVPAAGSLILILCSLLTGVVVALTSGLASLPAASLYLPPFNVVGGLLYYFLLVWVYGYSPNHLPGPLQVLKWLWNSPFRIGVIAAATAGSLLLFVFYPKPVGVHFIDVGQGDATLITTPHGKAVLVDTGGIMGDAANGYDIGARVVFPYLRHYGILSLDYLILTHGHQDHAGGAAGVAENIPVSHVLLPREEYSSPVQLLIRKMNHHGVIPMFVGQRILLDGVAFDILHAEGSAGSSGNEVSCVIRVSYGRHSFLLTGDLESQGEAEMIKNGGCIESTVFKSGASRRKEVNHAGFFAES